MDLLKASIYIIVVMMSVNAVAMMMDTVGMDVITPMNTTIIESGLNTTELVDSWGWSDNPFYDIATGLLAFWFATVPIIESFPYMLAVYGVPAFIYIPIHTIWRFMWLGAIALGIIAGRQT
jgi:hypothetical protein